MVERFTDLLGNRYKAEVLRFLKDNPDDFFTINELTKKTSGSNPSVKRFLEDLAELGLVKFRKKGNSYLIDYNNQSRYDEAVSSIFRVEIKELWNKARRYSSLLYNDENVGEHIKYVVLYGSVARGTADSNSDIDILVLVGHPDREEEVKDRALELAGKKSDEEIEIVPMIENTYEFEDNFQSNNRFEVNIVRDGEILEGLTWEDLL